MLILYLQRLNVFGGEDPYSSYSDFSLAISGTN